MLLPPLKLLGEGPGPPGPSSSYAYVLCVSTTSFVNRLYISACHGCEMRIENWTREIADKY